jgi:hypothetical protein
VICATVDTTYSNHIIIIKAFLVCKYQKRMDVVDFATNAPKTAHITTTAAATRILLGWLAQNI